MSYAKINKMDVSIVIVSWNTNDILRKCLLSVCEQTRDIMLEVIVVDNASTDGSTEMVKKNFSSVILIENSKNLGFSTANNQGIAIAKGRYVLLLNSDTIILNDVISKTVSFADNNPDAAVVGCKVLNPDRSLQPSCFMFPSILNMLLSTTYLYKIFSKNKFFGRERMTWWDRSDSRQVDAVTGCFMVVRREAIEQVGLLDEQFFMYGEETDWCYRFKQAGWKVLFTPTGEIIHFGNQSAISRLESMLLQLRGSILIFMKKHHSPMGYAFACVLIFAFFGLRVPIWAVLALIPGRKQKNAWQRCRIYLRGMFYSLLGGSRLCVGDKP
ncbi:MAG: glycosyltransferase family 2 protein [Planctomycetota bacterium]|jgi:GT2 family glycosyltransferase